MDIKGCMAVLAILGALSTGVAADQTRNRLPDGSPRSLLADCAPFCQECDSFQREKCVKCEIGYLLTKEQVCIQQQCKNKYCLECQNSQDPRTGERAERCTKCRFPLVVLDGVCELQCPPSTEKVDQTCVTKGSSELPSKEETKLHKNSHVFRWVIIIFLVLLFFALGIIYHRRKVKREAALFYEQFSDNKLGTNDAMYGSQGLKSEGLTGSFEQYSENSKSDGKAGK
jgi:hypothetical protein